MPRHPPCLLPLRLPLQTLLLQRTPPRQIPGLPSEQPCLSVTPKNRTVIKDLFSYFMGFEANNVLMGFPS